MYIHKFTRISWISYDFIKLTSVSNVYTNPSHLVPFDIQSTLVISNSKGLYETFRDIRTSTYQICGTEENN